MQRNIRIELTAGTTIIGILLIAIWVYWPGLNGEFILDDLPNLSGLARINANAQDWLNYYFLFILEGITGKLGRPISLFTFASQAHQWPSNPWAFKYVNLSIHLLNGCLVALFFHRLTRLLNMPSKQAMWMTVLPAGLWLIHPIHASTVLYVVQRMTELSALFTLAGLIAYLHGRERGLQGASHTGLAWMSASVAFGLLLGTLSKENGILLPIYILALEFTLLQGLTKPPLWRIWKCLFLYAPLLALAGYLLFNFDRVILGPYGNRDFSLLERLLTETRVLFDYLSAIVLPRPSSFGLFHDDYIISRSLFDPPQTLFTCLGIPALLATGLATRIRAPILSFGILWFLGGHILESTVIGLEIYFEHRNYLPSLGIIFTATYYASRLIAYINSRRLQIAALFSGLLWVAIFPIITWGEAQLWSNTHYQAIAWAQEKTDSRRARQVATGTYFEFKQYPKVVEALKSISRDWPSDSGSYLQLQLVRCFDKNLNVGESQETIHHLKTSAFDRGTISALRSIIELRAKGLCQAPNQDYLISLLDALLINPHFKSMQSDLYYILGNLYMIEGNLDAAMNALEQAQRIKHDPYIDMVMARWLGSAGLYKQALDRIDQARENAKQNPLKFRFLEDTLNNWKEGIRKSQKAADLVQRPKN